MRFQLEFSNSISGLEENSLSKTTGVGAANPALSTSSENDSHINVFGKHWDREWGHICYFLSREYQARGRIGS